MIIIKNFISSSNKEPYADWLDGLDTETQQIIASRINRIRLGNFGDCKIIQDGLGIWEFRISFGPGYRIYFGKEKLTIVILLMGGDKGSQKRDIQKAKKYWLHYKESLK